MKHFKKLNAKGFAHWVIPALAIVIIGGIGGVMLTLSHADTVTSVTIYPTNWSIVKGPNGSTGSVVTDGTQGSVLRLSPSATAVADIDKLAKLNTFMQANFGKAAKACIVARSTKAGYSAQLHLTNFTAASDHSKTLNFEPKTSYVRYCTTFTIIGKAGYNQVIASQGSTPSVDAFPSFYPLYVDRVTLSLQ